MAEVQIQASQPKGRALGIRMAINGEVFELTTLNDLAASRLQEDIRPRYTSEQVWYQDGEIGSDAAYVIHRSNNYSNRIGFLNGTRLKFEDKVIFQMPSHGMFQEDRSHRPGIPARFRWEGGV